MPTTNTQSWSQQMSSPKLIPTEKVRLLSRIKGLFTTKTFLGLIVILQIVIIALILNPVALYQQYQNQQVINEVGALTTLNTGETPVIAQVSDAEALRKENSIQAQVYKDAKNGDYVLGYTNKLIIYRKGETKLIYDGDTPSAVLTKNQELIITDISTKAKEAGLIDTDSQETPQVSVITDITKLKSENPTFYSIARNNDVVAVFSESQLIVLYNIESKSILNSGKFTTNIQKL